MSELDTLRETARRYGLSQSEFDALFARLEAAERVVRAARGFSFNRECFEGAMFSRDPVAADLADNDYESCLTALRDALAAYDAAKPATESEARS